MTLMEVTQAPTVWKIEVREQNLDELFWMLGQMNDCRSVLEIGSRGGGTLQMMASACGRGAKIRSIDITSNSDLNKAIRQMQEAGFDADWLIADSTSDEAMKWAYKSGPYDFIFIDGDHSYEGVNADWWNYGFMGKRVAFHDIANEQYGVKALWEKFKQSRQTSEKIVQDGFMGIGIVEP